MTRSGITGPSGPSARGGQLALRQRDSANTVGLVDVLQHRIAARHVAIERGIADAHLALVAGGQQHVRRTCCSAPSGSPRAGATGYSLRWCRARSANVGAASRRTPSTARLDRNDVMTATEQSRAVFRIFQARPGWYICAASSRNARVSGPSASTATAAEKAQSIPPDRPSTTPGKRLLVRHSRAAPASSRYRRPRGRRSSPALAPGSAAPAAARAVSHSRGDDRFLQVGQVQASPPSPLRTKHAPSNTSSSCPPTRLR